VKESLGMKRNKQVKDLMLYTTIMNSLKDPLLHKLTKISILIGMENNLMKILIKIIILSNGMDICKYL